MGKRELVALLNLSSWCLLMVERLFLAVPQGCLRFVIVVFPDHTHLLFKMQQHIDFPMEISVLKFQAWPDEKPAFLSCFSKRSTHILVVTCLRLQFRPVGSGWQWISEGLNRMRFLFKFVT